MGPSIYDVYMEGRSGLGGRMGEGIKPHVDVHTQKN